MNRTDYTRIAVAAPWSPRQLEVWELVAEGMPTKAIARRLGIAEGSVRIHLGVLYRKLGVANRTAAAAAWHRRAE